MPFDAWITIGVLVVCIVGLFYTTIGPDLVLVAGLTALLVLGVVEPLDALAGFSNEGMLTVAVFYVVAAGLRETGALDFVVDRIFGRANTLLTAQTRIMLPVIVLSSIVTNTPIVASFIPAVSDWARKQGFSPSKLMMPLSYAAIFGGCCTIIGTSTNLIINGMLISEGSARSLGFFELAWIGVPCAVVGFIYVLLASDRLLETRVPALETLKNPREYTVEMVIRSGSPLTGKSMDEAGLRHVPGLYLVEIERDGQAIPATAPEEVLQEDDQLVFAGITESIMDLQKIRGLEPATEQLFELDSPRPMRSFIEAVVSSNSPFVGQSIREAHFRANYGAVVIAVAREGKRIETRVSDIELSPGDTLLLEADPGFVERHRNSRDFLLLRPIFGSSPPHYERSWVAWLILGGIVISASTGLLDLLNAALLGAGLMLATKCCSANVARESIDLQVIIVIAAALGIGRAIEVTGAGESIARSFLSMAGTNPWVLLSGVFIMTSVLTAMVTNTAAAVLMFPIALASAGEIGVNFIPFAVTIAMAASASFATPIGYQTNLMVYGPGGYKFSDYVKFGLPLTILIGVTTVGVVPLIWKLV